MNSKSIAPLTIFAAIAICSVTKPALGAQSEAPYTAITRYDLAGRVTGIISPDPDVGGSLRLLATRNTYTGALLTRVESGQLTSFPNEDVPVASWSSYGFAIFQTREFTYDASARKMTESIKGTDGSTVESMVQYSYDSKNRVQCKAVRMNKVAFGSLPASACTLGTAGADGPDRITRYTYDSFDQVLTEKRGVGTTLAQTYLTNVYFSTKRLLQYQTDANGNKTELQYDAHDRLKKRIYPHPTTAGSVNTADYNEYGYDENGNRNYERKRNTSTISTTFDANNRPTFKNLSINTYSQDVVYDFDLRGLTLATMFATEAGVSTGVGVTNSYDGLGRRGNSTSNVGGFSRTLTYQYDNNGNRTRVTHQDGNYALYHFDGLNRVDGIYENASVTPMLTVTYRTNGQRLNLGPPGGATTTYIPDNAKRLLSFAQDFAGTADDLTNTLSYNAASQVIQLVQSNDQYSYGGNQNRAGTYAPNGLNQYTTIGGQTVSHDTNGNLTADGTGMTFTYDMENRLVSTASPTSSLKYDPLGRLAEVTVVPGATTQFLYDGDALVAEYTISSGVATQTRRYVHGNRVDEPLVQYNGTNLATRRYLHADHEGSVVAHSSNTGAILAKLAYDNFGVPANGPGPTPVNSDRFGFTGQVWLKEMGLNYYKSRMYAPRIGRFLQTDPIFYDDDMNLYAYAGNDPLNNGDPTGLAQCAKSLTEERCEKALNDSDAARDSARSAASGLRDVAGRMKEGKLTDSDKAALKVVEQRFGKNFTDEKGLGKLAKGLDGAANKIGARGEGAMLRQGKENGNYLGLVIPFTNSIRLGGAYFSETDSVRQKVMLHEASHLNYKFGDEYIWSGVEDNARYGKGSAFRNADTYACAVYPEACGFK